MAKKEKITHPKNVSIMSSVYPTEQLAFNEWCRELMVSCQYVKKEVHFIYERFKRTN
jgi:hypothetical protein